jgi:hypothetical protein
MKNWNWKKIWQVIIGIIGMIGAGAGGGAAYNAATTEEPAPTPTEYASPAVAGNTWTVVAWIIQDKLAGGNGTPAVRYSDNLGRYTVFVDTPRKPGKEDILKAFDPSLNPANVRLDIVQVLKPDGGPVLEPDEPVDE